jgi:mannose-6-phosphate isomerase-like protein (cupin superfamily)
MAIPVMHGYVNLDEVPEEKIGDKITRRIVVGDKGMIVFWRMKAGAHAARHQHPHEQIFWMISGRMDFDLDGEKRVCRAGDCGVIPGNTPTRPSSPRTPRSSTSSRRPARTCSPGGIPTSGRADRGY